MSTLQGVDLPPDEVDVLLRRLVGRTVGSFTLHDFTWILAFREPWAVATEGSWRLLDAEGVVVTDHDHRQRFGLPAPLDAAHEVAARLRGRMICKASIARPAGDLMLEFGDGLVLQWLIHSSGYESWRLSGPGVELLGCGGGRIRSVVALDAPPDEAPSQQ